MPDFDLEEVEALLGFLYGKFPEISSSEEVFKSLAMDCPILELEVEVTSNSLPVNPGELFSNYVEASDIETAEVLIDNNNYLGDGEGEGGLTQCRVCSLQFLRHQDLADHWPLHPQCGVCGESVLDWAELEKHERSHRVMRDALNITANLDLGVLCSGDLGKNGLKEKFIHVVL